MILEVPKSDLVTQVRRFWFNNVPGAMELDGYRVTRKDIYTYGGPNPFLSHPVTQKMEWLSRVYQKNLFEPHDSPDETECKTLCERQGDELWTHHHQNFDFALGCDPELNAPRGLVIWQERATKIGRFSPYTLFQRPNCDQWHLVLKRRLAKCCQFDLSPGTCSMDWSQYDFLLIFHSGEKPAYSRPKIPVVLYCHDMWPEKPGFQEVFDLLEPDILLTPYPSPWRENFRLTPHTRVVFAPFAPSLFFTRSNPDVSNKNLDLLVIGAVMHPIYLPRVVLSHQIRRLTKRYRIEFIHNFGGRRVYWSGANIKETKKGQVRYLNQWSAFLGSAKYVIFGRLGSEAHQFVLGKYYECLGSGAVPIFPEVPDLKLLGISPFEHYIPLSEVEGRNDRLTYYMDNYEKYHYIAENAVKWCKTQMDRLLFDDFETMIHELTGKRFPKRLID